MVGATTRLPEEGDWHENQVCSICVDWQRRWDSHDMHHNETMSQSLVPAGLWGGTAPTLLLLGIHLPNPDHQ